MNCHVSNGQPRRWSIAALLLPLTLFFAAAAAPAQVNATSPLGTNFARVEYFGSELVFVDLMKQSSDWIPQLVSGGPWTTGATLDVDADDWIKTLQPGQAAATLMRRSIEGHYPGGKYLVLWDGDGDLEVSFDATATLVTPGRIEMDVNPSDAGILLRVIRTEPSNPARNIRVIPASAEQTYVTQPFEQAFLDRWQYFKVLRFMDWSRTNETTVGTWAQRTRPTARTQAIDHGVAYEYMLEFANAIDADPWICVPHLADDNFVTQLANLCKATLKPGITAYVEYSNEVWNPLYPAQTYAAAAGLGLGLSTNTYEASLRFYGQRSVEIFNIFRQALGNNRVYRVLSGQTVNPYVLQTALSWQNVGQNVDGIAVAPYIGTELGSPAKAFATSQMSLAQVFYETYLDIGKSMQNVATHKQIADQYGVDLITYEGGQSLVGFGGMENLTTLTTLLTTVNRHFAMFYLYDLYLTAWRAAGGRLFMHFNSTSSYSKWGSWGAFEWHDQSPLTAFKYLGMLVFWTKNPRWW